MKILTISPTYDLQRGSGIVTVIRNICERLVRRGHICNIITINKESSDDVDELINGIEVKRIGSPLRKYLYGLSPAMYRYFRGDAASWLKREDVDIIHIHMYHNLLSLQLIYLLRNCGKPIIFTPHYHGRGHNRFASLLLELYQPLGKQMFKHVDKIVCVSEYEERLIRNDFSVPQEAVKLIPHGISIADIKPHNKKANKNPHISILFVGRLEEHKGVQHILRAMRQLKDVHQMQPVLDIVGKGPYKKHLMKLAHDLSLEHDVIWNSFLTNEELWQKYRDTDIFLLLSRLEAYGLVVAEALASGTPTIVSDTSALSEFIGEAGCFGIKYPLQSEKLARLIVDIHQSDVQVGPFDPLKIRTWDKVTDEYEQLYQEFG